MPRQNILITGAGSGLGQALALQLADEDTHLFLLDISLLGLEQTQSLINAIGGQCSLHQQDLSDLKGLQRWLDTLNNGAVKMDWLINCAGITLTSSMVDISTNQWRHILSVNLLSTILLCTVVGQQMMDSGTGRIINISSMFGLLPAPSGIAYATTKHALVGFTRTLSVEMENTGVEVHLVCPGFINTGLFQHAEYNGVSKERLLPDTRNMMTSTEAARRIIHGVHRNKRWIIFPFYVRILCWLEWYTPRIARYLWVKQWLSFLQKRTSRMTTDHS